MSQLGVIRLVAAVVVAATAWASATLRAEPMAKDACDAAEAERATLVAGGVPEALKKGPAWAKANLAAAKIKDVERYIALQEQLLFKCGHAKLRTLPTPDADEEGQVAPKEAAADKIEAPPAVAKRKPAAKNVTPRTTAVGAADAAKAEPTKSEPKPRAKPKPKANDAYKPPQKQDPPKG